jgi:2-polyprenyl-3-methyl-5-hydroxy-6-metoxy-1,4-benzoquinol methylase
VAKMTLQSRLVPRRVDLPDSEYTVRDQRRMQAASRYFEWQFELAKPHIGQRVLEVGCGVGNVTTLLEGLDLVVGIDMEPECIRERMLRFSGRANIFSELLDVLDPQFPELAKYGFDSIVCFNVLEHISDDRKALEHMLSVLQPGGKLILIIPAFESLYGPIDSNLGHFRRYSKAGISELAKSVGFEVAAAHYMNFVGFFGWWLNARILRKTEQSEHQIRIFDSWVVPVSSRLEGLVHPPCGQSIFAVLDKCRS